MNQKDLAQSHLWVGRGEGEGACPCADGVRGGIWNLFFISRWTIQILWTTSMVQAEDRLLRRRYRFIINIEVAVDIAEEDTCLLAGLLLADGLLPPDISYFINYHTSSILFFRWWCYWYCNFNPNDKEDTCLLAGLLLADGLLPPDISYFINYHTSSILFFRWWCYWYCNFNPNDKEDTCLLAGLLLADGLLPPDPTSCCFATSSFSRRPVLPASSSRIRCKVCFANKRIESVLQKFKRMWVVVHIVQTWRGRRGHLLLIFDQLLRFYVPNLSRSTSLHLNIQ